MLPRAMNPPSYLPHPPTTPDLHRCAQAILQAANGHPAPFVIAICGGSCTGKSTHFARALANLLPFSSASIEIDHLQSPQDPSELDPVYRWDHPQLYNLTQAAAIIDTLKSGLPANIPVFDFLTRTVTSVRAIEPAPFLLVEGLYASTPPLTERADFRLYLESPAKERLIRRIFRSRHERYRNVDPTRTIEGFLTSVTAAHLSFVIPQAAQADARLSLPYKFADTIARFGLAHLGPAPARPGHIWAKLPDAHIEIGLPNAPHFRIVSNHQLYLDTPIPPSLHALLTQADPDTL